MSGRALFEALLTFWNPVCVPRMYGGVRGRGLAASPYSISMVYISV